MPNNIQSVSLRLGIVEQFIQNFLANSVQPKDGQSTTNTTDDTLFPIQNVGEAVKFIRKADFLTVVLGSVRQISDANSEVDAVGQIAIGQKAGINGGRFFVGQVNFYPPTQDSHINKIYYSL